MSHSETAGMALCVLLLELKQLLHTGFKELGDVHGELEGGVIQPFFQPRYGFSSHTDAHRQLLLRHARILFGRLGEVMVPIPYSFLQIDLPAETLTVSVLFVLLPLAFFPFVKKLYEPAQTAPAVQTPTLDERIAAVIMAATLSIAVSAELGIPGHDCCGELLRRQAL